MDAKSSDQPTTDPAKLERVLDSLLVRTRNNEIRWRVNPGNANQYVFESEGGVLVTVDSRDDDGIPPVDLYILGGPSRTLVVDRLRWVGSAANHEHPLNMKLRALYSMAQDAAINVEQIVDSLLTELGGGQS